MFLIIQMGKLRQKHCWYYWPPVFVGTGSDNLMAKASGAGKTYPICMVI